MLQRFLIVCLVLFGGVLVACSGGDQVAGGGSPSPGPVGSTATVVVRHPLLRAIPSGINELRFVGRDTSGAVVFGPETRPKAGEIRLQVPVTATRLHIEYLTDGQLTGVFSTPLSLTAGEVFVLQDPKFTLLSELVSLAVHPKSALVTQGGTQAFTAEGRFTGGTVHDVTPEAAWSSSDPSVATVDANGRVSAVAPGIATITASLQGQSASGQVRVTAATLQTLTVSPQSATVPHGGTQQFTVIGTDSDGTTVDVTEQVTWSSGNPAVATVDSTGLATGQSVGTTSIQASLSGLTAGASLAVQPSSGALQGNRNFVSDSGEDSVAVGDFDGKNGPDIVLGQQRLGVIQVFLNQGDGTYAGTPDEYPVPGGQFTVVGLTVADFDGQNGPDIACANFGDNSVSVFFNQGNGTFGSPLRLASGTSLQGIASGDLDGANGPDIAVVDQGTNSILLYFNQGNGTFGPQVSHFGGVNPTDLAIGDLDGANGPDIAVTQNQTNQVMVLWNQGGGNYAIATDQFYDTNTGPFGVAIGDLDGKNGADLAVACAGSSSVSVLFNQGGQTFNRTDVNAGPGPFAVAVGDFDGKNGLDLAAPTQAQGVAGTSVTTAILLNQGSGSFSTSSIDTGDFTDAVVTSDLDGKNGDDLVLGHFGLSVALNQGNGLFYPYATYALGYDVTSGGVAAGDLEGTNGPDVVVGGDSQISVLLNDGQGHLGAPVDYPLGSTGGGAVALADFDDKTGLDVAAVNKDGVAVLLNQGDGTLRPAVQYPVSGGSSAIAVGNFDGQNGPDIAVVKLGNSGVSIFYNRGDGTFEPAVTLATPSDANCVAAGNFDGQNGDDLVVGAEASGNPSLARVFLSQGAGFDAGTDYPVQEAPFAIAVGDFDGQNGLDIAVDGLDENSYGILLNQGNGTFGTEQDQALHFFAFGLASGDMDGDGRDDLVAAGSSLGVVTNPLAPPPTLTRPTYAQHSFSAAVADFNRDGLPDVAAPLDDRVAVMLGQP